MLGCGVGISFRRGGRMGPAGLASRLRGIASTQLMALWVPDDSILNASGGVTSIPGQGVSALTSGGAYHYTITRVNGRAFLANTNTAQNKYLTNDLTGWRTAVVVTTRPTLPSANGYHTLVSGGGGTSNALILDASGTSTWFSTGAAHYRDGVSSETFADDAGPHVYEGVIPVIGGRVSFAGRGEAGLEPRWWDGLIGALALFSGTLSAGDRASIVALLHQYYSIRL